MTFLPSPFSSFARTGSTKSTHRLTSSSSSAFSLSLISLFFKIWSTKSKTRLLTSQTTRIVGIKLAILGTRLKQKKASLSHRWILVWESSFSMWMSVSARELKFDLMRSASQLSESYSDYKSTGLSIPWKPLTMAHFQNQRRWSNS